MGKKELKRLLKLYKSDLNSMADECIFYEARAAEAQAMVERLIEEGCRLPGWTIYSTWYQLVSEWRNDPPKNYRSEQL